MRLYILITCVMYSFQVTWKDSRSTQTHLCTYVIVYIYIDSIKLVCLMLMLFKWRAGQEDKHLTSQLILCPIWLQKTETKLIILGISGWLIIGMQCHRGGGRPFNTKSRGLYKPYPWKYNIKIFVMAAN